MLSGNLLCTAVRMWSSQCLMAQLELQFEIHTECLHFGTVKSESEIHYSLSMRYAIFCYLHFRRFLTTLQVITTTYKTPLYFHLLNYFSNKGEILIPQKYNYLGVIPKLFGA